MFPFHPLENRGTVLKFMFQLRVELSNEGRAGRRGRAGALTRGSFNAEHILDPRISRAGGLGWDRSQALELSI